MPPKVIQNATFFFGLLYEMHIAVRRKQRQSTTIRCMLVLPMYPCSIKSTFYHHVKLNILCFFLCTVLLVVLLFCIGEKKTFFTHFIPEHWINAKQCFYMMWTKVSLYNNNIGIKKKVYCLHVRLFFSDKQRIECQNISRQ